MKFGSQPAWTSVHAGFSLDVIKNLLGKLKKILLLSLLLNCALASLWLWPFSGKQTVPAVPTPLIAEKLTAPVAIQKEESAPFSWRNLESSSSYVRYVTNLRAIGCPEPTVEDIVWGDTDRAFSLKRRQLNLDGSGYGAWSQAAENQLVARLLGQPEAGPAGGLLNASIQSAKQKTVALTYPLVFQSVDAATLGLSEEQKKAIAEIQQQFIEEIGGTNQNPADPAYLERWQKAQPAMDEVLKGWLGGQAFMDYAIAAQESNQNAAATNP